VEPEGEAPTWGEPQRTWGHPGWNGCFFNSHHSLSWALAHPDFGSRFDCIRRIAGDGFWLGLYRLWFHCSLFWFPHCHTHSASAHNVCQTEGGNFFNSCSGTCRMCGRLIAAPAWCLWFVWISFWPTALARCRKGALKPTVCRAHLFEIYAKVNT